MDFIFFILKYSHQEKLSACGFFIVFLKLLTIFQISSCNSVWISFEKSPGEKENNREKPSC